MAFFIADDCIGCTICAKKCPVFCIWGTAGPGHTGLVKEMHVIDPTVCIECGACASYCPVDCIANEKGVIEKKIEAKKRPIAIVREDNCTGCEWCVDVCPFDCLEMVPRPGVTPEQAAEGSQMDKVARDVRPKDCVGCKLCEEVCIQKDAIVVLWPDGSYCDNLGVRTTLENPNHQNSVNTARELEVGAPEE